MIAAARRAAQPNDVGSIRRHPTHLATRIRQRLAAILAADAAGYSRLMSLDEEAALAALDAARETFRQAIDDHNGRVIDMAGDSVLAVFETAASAVNAALKIQQALKERSIAASPERRMQFRIGVHLGDMIEKPDGSVYGGGVNIAARLQAVATPGGISISEAVRSSVRNRVAASFEDLGRQEMKNIDEPVHAFRVLPHEAHVGDGSLRSRASPDASDRTFDPGAKAPHAWGETASSAAIRRFPRTLPLLLALLLAASVVAALVYGSQRGALSRSGNPASSSIAVLPFVDMSENHDQEYFSDGLSEELIDRLANADGLRVIARTSSFQFKGKNEDARAIAQKLGVTHLLEGSVRKSGQELRITAQLIRASDGTHQWSRTYSRNVQEVFTVQDDIARTVAQALSSELRLQPRNDEGRPSSVSAYNAFLEGIYYASHNNKTDLAKAIGLYKQAIQLEPTYAMAWVRLADAHSTLGENFGSDEDVVEARAALARGLQLDPSLPAAHAARASLLRSFDWDWQGAAVEYRRANELSSDSHRYDVGLTGVGLLFGRIDESIAAKRVALERNPLSVGLLNGLGHELYLAGRYEEAANALRKASELNASYAASKSMLATVLLFQQRTVEAQDAAEQEPDDAWKASVLPIVYWAIGRKEQSDAALTRLKTDFASTSAFQIAEAHAYRGEISPAMDWLEKAYAQRDSGVQWSKVDPLLANLRGDPRYVAFLVKLKLDGDGRFAR